MHNYLIIQFCVQKTKEFRFDQDVVKYENSLLLTSKLPATSYSYLPNQVKYENVDSQSRIIKKIFVLTTTQLNRAALKKKKRDSIQVLK